MTNYEGDTFSEVYEQVLRDTVMSPDYVIQPRNLKINELTDVSLTFDPLFPLYENKKRSSQFKYIAGELIWYFNGMNDCSFISLYSNFWQRIKNKDNTCNSAYGNLIFTERENGYTQWAWALESLLNDKDTRQAVLHFNKPTHQYKDVKDFVCTMYGIFQIRNNQLNFTVHMRSNDLVLGTPTDVAFFCLLQQQMHKYLLKKYPKLRLGMYTHFVNSLHIYEKNLKLVNNMLDCKFTEMKFPPLRDDLILKTGYPTENTKQLKKDVVLKSNSKYTTHLFNWINSWSTINIHETLPLK
tara:strand:+ start:9232 stop:10122 length:891 start_codon:yes stop_codon:yes gene_type:complete